MLDRCFKALEITQLESAELARFLGVDSYTVDLWTAGKAAPNPPQEALLVIVWHACKQFIADARPASKHDSGALFGSRLRYRGGSYAAWHREAWAWVMKLFARSFYSQDFNNRGVK